MEEPSKARPSRPVYAIRLRPRPSRIESDAERLRADFGRTAARRSPLLDVGEDEPVLEVVVLVVVLLLDGAVEDSRTQPMPPAM